MTLGGKTKMTGDLTVEAPANPTRVSVILDRSGSMVSMRNEVISGFNALLDEQRKVPGKTRWSMTQFDFVNKVSLERPFTDVKGKDVPYLTDETFVPRGSTPLLDAVGTELARLGESPDPTIVVIITDGLENSSREYDKDQIRKMISVREDLGWQFIFLAANQDAFASRQDYGFDQGTHSVTFNHATVGAAYGAAGQSMTGYRQAGTVSASHDDVTTGGYDHNASGKVKKDSEEDSDTKA